MGQQDRNNQPDHTGYGKEGEEAPSLPFGHKLYLKCVDLAWHISPSKIKVNELCGSARDECEAQEKCEASVRHPRGSEAEPNGNSSGILGAPFSPFQGRMHAVHDLF